MTIVVHLHEMTEIAQVTREQDFVCGLIRISNRIAASSATLDVTTKPWVTYFVGSGFQCEPTIARSRLLKRHNPKAKGTSRPTSSWTWGGHRSWKRRRNCGHGLGGSTWSGATKGSGCIPTGTSNRLNPREFRAHCIIQSWRRPVPAIYSL